MEEKEHKGGWLTVLLCCNTGWSGKLQPHAMGSLEKHVPLKLKNCSCIYKANQIA
jgi:hypothetical protein